MPFGGTLFNFVTGVSTDITAPLLSSTLPADNSTDLSRTPTLFVYFNEGVKAGAGNVEIRRSSDGNLLQSIAITDTNHVQFYENQVAINLTSSLDWSTEYYVTFGAGVIEDFAGNDFVGISSPTAFSFSTMGDPVVSPPILIETFPYEGYGPLRIDGAASLIFSEYVKSGTGTVEIRRASDNALATSINITDSGQVSFYQDRATIDWQINLDPYTEYYVLVSPGAIEDFTGADFAGISSSARLTFTTGPLIPPDSPPISGGVFANSGVLGPDAEAPWLTQILPVDDAANFPIEGNLFFRFSEQVTAGSGNLEIRHSSDGTLFKSIALSDTSQVTFQPSPYLVTVNPNVNLELNTGYYIVLQPNAVQDLAGNPYAGFSSPAAFNFTTASASDTTVPVLIEMTPDAGVEVSTSYAIVLVFDENVQAGTGNIEVRRLLDGSLFSSISITDSSQVTFSVNGVFIYPSLDFDDASAYYVTFGSGVIKDLAGNAFGGVTASHFTTADENDPVLLSTSPAADATNIAVNASIVLTFDEPVQAGEQFIFVSVGSQAEFVIDVNDTSQVTFYENTVTINPNADLIPGTTYTVSVSPGSVRDLAGNAYFGIDTGNYTFTTASAPSGLTLTGNGLSNTLLGGAGNDTITGLGGNDTLTGAAGSDTFVYGAVSHSTSRNYDTITDFDGSSDVLDFWFQVTGLDASITGGSVGSRRFDSDLASAVNSTKLAAHHAVLFTPSAGAPAGSKFLIVDANGVAGYQAGADIVILLGANSTNLGSLTASDFV
jgi:large repetitive protein